MTSFLSSITHGKWATIMSFIAPLALAIPQSYISVFPDQHHQDPSLPFSYVNPRAPKGGNISFGVIGNFTSFNPFSLKGIGAEGIGSLLYATLFKASGEDLGVSYPYAAESVDISSAEVTFILRSGITFHDGSPITPEDIIFSFTYLTEQLPSLKQYYGDIKEVKKTGDNRVTFILKPGAAKEAALILSELPVLSSKFFKAHDLEANPLLIPIGSGPYRIAKFKPGNFVVYEKVENWWGNSLPANQGFYNFQTVRYEYFHEYAVCFEAFKKGDIDVFIEIMAKNWQKGYDFPAVKEGRIKKEEVPFEGPVGHVGFIFNTRKELFRNERIRKALNLMFDFDEMNKNLFFSGYQRITSLFPNTEAQAKGKPSQGEVALLKELETFSQEVQRTNDSKGEMKETALIHGREVKVGIKEKIAEKDHVIPLDVHFPLYEKDLYIPVEEFTIPKGTMEERRRQALALFQQAGWHLKNGVMSHAKLKPFQFTVLSNNPMLDKVFQRFQKSLASIGVTMHIRFVDSMQYMQLVRDFNFDIIYGVFTSSGITPGNELVDRFSSKVAHKKGSHNLAGIENVVIDEMIRRILACQSYDELMTHAKVFDRIVMAFHYTIPGWTLATQRIAYWNNKFGKSIRNSRYGVDFMTWWSQPNP